MILSLLKSRTRQVVLPIAAVAAMTAAPVFGAAVNPGRPILPTDIGFEDNLQEVFDGITVSGTGIDAVGDQSNAALFASQASGGAVATFIIELTAGAATQKFGIYSDGDTSNRAEIFDGSDTTESQAFVSFFANGDIKVNNVLTATSFNSAFGFYLESGASLFFTEDDENGGTARALTYQGQDDTMLQIGGLAPGMFSANEWIIAFEDGSDFDYQDMVVLVESVHPVPVPAAAMAGIPMLVLMGLRKIRKQRQA